MIGIRRPSGLELLAEEIAAKRAAQEENPIGDGIPRVDPPVVRRAKGRRPRQHSPYAIKRRIKTRIQRDSRHRNRRAK